ncbi:MAG TPA: ABC transporter ATP-binding protein [Mycobacteriales bacterium]|nr:ABC transporter ATP-binding protein [Mycobacteriales bacterium]
MGAEVAVACRDVEKRFAATQALAGASFTAPLGAITALLGRNGAGKTTAVSVATGQIRADAGTVTVLGRQPRDAGLRSRVGVMPQPVGSGAAGVYPSARVTEVLALFASFHRNPLELGGLLERLDLTRVAGTQWRRLSGGEQQRVSLALALVGRPELVFLDEPSAGLDVHGRLSMWQLLEELRAVGVTVVMTTHDMEEAEHLADHLIVIDRGRVVAAGAVAELAAGDAPQLVFDATSGLPVAELQAGLPNGTTVREVRPGHYVVSGAIDPAIVADVTAWCSERGVLPQRLETRGRSLEDLFLELTGRP